MQKYDYSKNKNALERELCPIESFLMKLSDFSSGQNIEKKCLAYANRFIEKGYKDAQIERAVEVWIDTGKGFPSFSDLRIIADSFQQRVDVSSEIKPCPHQICDASRWVDLVDNRGYEYTGKCKCHPEQNDFMFADMIKNKKISPRYAEKIKAMYADTNELRAKLRVVG